MANSVQVQTPPPPALQSVWVVGVGCLPKKPRKVHIIQRWVKDTELAITDLNQAGERADAQRLEAILKKIDQTHKKDVHWNPLDGNLSSKLTIRLQGAGAIAFLVIKVGLLCVHRSHGTQIPKDALRLLPLIKAALKDADGKKFCETIGCLDAMPVASCFLRCVTATTPLIEDIEELLLGAIDALARTDPDTCEAIIGQTLMRGLWGKEYVEQFLLDNTSSKGGLWDRKPATKACSVFEKIDVLRQGLKDPRRRLRGALEVIRTKGGRAHKRTPRSP